MNTGMDIVEDRIGSVVVVRVKSSRIDAAAAPAFRLALAPFVKRGLPHFVLDLSAVGFIDSTGLGALVSSLKAGTTPAGVAIAGAKDSVAALFKLTRMDKVFRLFPSDSAAASALAG
ncbi:MAG TPA: STAS domain-containing protein [Polyangia bacterium]